VDDDVVGKIYAIYENSNTISVFHAIPPYEQLRGIHVSGLVEPTDIVACTVNGLLYVPDHAKGCVWQVTTGGKVNYRLLTSGPTRRKTSAVFPVSLSVRFGRLVVVETNRILIYDSRDNKVDEMMFPASATLYHGLETDCHAYLVALSENNRSTIQEMGRGDNGWLTLREWNLRSYITSVQPVYMALDVSGFLYVVMHESSKVLVLDNELNEVQSVRLKRRFIPSRLCFLTQRHKSLLVVGAGFSVNIYDAAISKINAKKAR